MKDTVILAHDGNFQGTSDFNFPDYPFPYKKGMTMEDLKKAYDKKMRKGEGLTDGARETYLAKRVGKISGGVVIDKRILKAMEIVRDGKGNNRFEASIHNHILKRIAWHCKVSYIGNEMVDEWAAYEDRRTRM